MLKCSSPRSQIGGVCLGKTSEFTVISSFLTCFTLRNHSRKCYGIYHTQPEIYLLLYTSKDIYNGTVTFKSSLEVFQNFTYRVPMSESESHSVMPNSLRPHELQFSRLLCPWDLPGKNTGAGCHFLLPGIFPTQELNLGLLHCRVPI